MQLDMLSYIQIQQVYLAHLASLPFTVGMLTGTSSQLDVIAAYRLVQSEQVYIVSAQSHQTGPRKNSSNT